MTQTTTAVDGGRAVGRDRQRLQAGEERQHHEGGPLPDVDQDDRVEGQRGRGQHRGVLEKAEPLEHVGGEQTPRAGEHDLPEDGHHDGRHHGGHEQDGHEHGPQPDALMQDERAREAEAELKGHGDGDDHRRDPDTVPETGVAEQGRVVAEPRPVPHPRVLHLVQRQVDRVDEGHDGDQHQRHHRRRDQHIRKPAPLGAPARSCERRLCRRTPVRGGGSEGGRSPPPS
jgi:hypothetical protein